MSYTERVYRSKHGVVTYIPVMIMAVVVGIDIHSGTYWNTVFILVLFAVVILPMLLNTCYTITPDAYLQIRCGWMVNMKFDIHNIRKIEDTHNVLSSPALSLDRIEIFYNKFDSVMVSPDDKDQFIADLKRIKPSIEYEVFAKD